MSSSVTIGSALKRGRGRNDAIVSVTGSSDGESVAVIATNESEEGSSESTNDGLVVRQSKRAKADFSACDTSVCIIPSSSSSSAGALSSEGALIVSNVQFLLGPIVSQLQSISQKQTVQDQQFQLLSATVSSLSASLSSMKEDVAILVKTALPLTLVGGGLRSSNVLSVLYGAHGIGKGIFGFLDCVDGNNLRLVCHEMRTAVAAFPWNDKETCIKESLCSWRTCFPNARAASLWGRRAPLLDADFRFFRGLHHLQVSRITSFSDAAFSQLSGLKHLDILCCTQLTDAIFPHLVGLKTLIVEDCSQAGMTGTAFEPLRGSIREINTIGCNEVVKAAARAIAPRSMAYYLFSIAAALPTYGSDVLEDGRSVNQRQLYFECLRLYPQFSSAYNNLGNLLPSSERVTLPDGRSMNERELYLEAIKHDPRNEHAYNNLANRMTADERVRLPDGRSMSNRELYVESLRLKPRYANTYHQLAFVMTAEERVELPDGCHMSKREVYLECLRHIPRDATAFGNLAFHSSSATESISLPDGRSMCQRELYLEALRIDPRYVFVLKKLSDTMTTETITLPDNQVMTQEQLRTFAATIA